MEKDAGDGGREGREDLWKFIENIGGGCARKTIRFCIDKLDMLCD